MKLKNGGDSTAQFDVRNVWYVPMFSDGEKDAVAVGAASAPFATLVLKEGHWYVVTANTDMWVAQGPTGVAAGKGTAGSIFVLKGKMLLLDGAHGAQVAVIEDAAIGLATIQDVTVY